MASVEWPSFDGELGRDPEALRRYRSDFGREVEAEPRAALIAASADDVARAVRFARAEKIPVAARGQGHTTRGQSLAPDGLVIDTARLDRVLEIGGDFVRVEAGARWQALLAATLARGLTPPVLTDYLELSVGGTLSVGGVGGQSFRHGLQLDNVLELSVVTGDGELVRCSPERDAWLFDACRGGLGQFGIIVEAKLRLVPAPGRVRVFHLPYRDLDTFLAAQHVIAEDGRFDYLVGNFHRDASGWRYPLECVSYRAAPDDALLDGLGFTGAPERRELGYFDYATRLAAAVSELRRSGAWQGVHPWIDLFVPASRAPKTIASALAALEPSDLDGGYVMTYPLLRDRCRAKFPGLPDEKRLFLFDVLLSFAPGSPARARFAAHCDRWLTQARSDGATVYPIGFPVGTERMRSADWRAQLGASYDSLARTKRDADPANILNPVFNMFS